MSVRLYVCHSASHSFGYPFIHSSLWHTFEVLFFALLLGGTSFSFFVRFCCCCCFFCLSQETNLFSAFVCISCFCFGSNSSLPSSSSSSPSLLGSMGWHSQSGGLWRWWWWWRRWRPRPQRLWCDGLVNGGFHMEFAAASKPSKSERQSFLAWLSDKLMLLPF